MGNRSKKRKLKQHRHILRNYYHIQWRVVLAHQLHSRVYFDEISSIPLWLYLSITQN